MVKTTVTFAARGAKAKCEFDLESNLPGAKVDEGQVGQVISNLIINANQAMPQGGIITIRSRNIEFETKSETPLPPGRYIKISFEDQGVGISAEHLPNIFNPFFTTKQEGSGLGLSVIYSIIKKHDGHISVASSLDEGSTFTVYLPATGKKPARPNHKEALQHKGQGMILIMDDQTAILEMAARLLERIGYDTVLTTNGAQAVEKYREAYQSGKPFDAVILDLTVPGGLGGAEVIVELLKIDPKVKAIVSSGYSTDPVMADYLKYGFCGIAPKPYTKDQLIEVLENIHI
ncbi:MAG: response regulator [Desulfobacteraceae bacterium]|nr:response regulator [Desulfobacteraceae bacterium]